MASAVEWYTVMDVPINFRCLGRFDVLAFLMEWSASGTQESDSHSTFVHFDFHGPQVRVSSHTSDMFSSVF